MENMLFYLLDGLLTCGDIVPSTMKTAGEDAWRIDVELNGRFVHCWTLLRSEIRVIRDAYEERKAYMCDNERERIEKLISVL